LLKELEEEATYLYHPDHLGSVSVVSNQRGLPYERVEYLPFGEVWIEETDPATGYIPFRFTSKELDEETGLYYHGARYYEPTISRWMSADPAGFALISPMGSDGKPKAGYSIIEAANWYAYVSNNPVIYVDPTGMEEVVGTDMKDNLLLGRNHKPVSVNVTVTRPTDGYGNEFNSTASLDSIEMENGQVLKVGASTPVGANAKSENFAEEHDGMTLPDGDGYYLTGEGKYMYENSEGGYDSPSYHNVFRIKVHDRRIDPETHNKINMGMYLFHATQYKNGIVRNGISRWFTPSSAGCISAPGNQSGHDRIMNQIPNVKPSNIKVKIQSLNNIRYHYGNKLH